MKWFKDNYLNSNDSLDILDVGSLDNSGDNYNYRSIFDNPNWRYTGLDFEKGDNVDILVEDIYNWGEIQDKSFDVVISGQLFEHLGFFWLTMSEIERAMKKGGLCCIIAPSGGPRHGVSDSDCYRFYEDGMVALANYAELDVVHVSTNTDDISKPWYDTCLIAKKEGILNNNVELERKMENLENKLDIIIKRMG